MYISTLFQIIIMLVLHLNPRTLYIHVVAITLTAVKDFRWFLSQFSSDCYEILQALFYSDAATTMKHIV